MCNDFTTSKQEHPTYRINTLEENLKHGNTNTSALRIEAQIELKSIRQRPNESLLGLRAPSPSEN